MKSLISGGDWSDWSMGGASNAYWKFSGPIIRNENQCAATSITRQLGRPITMIGGADTRTSSLTHNPAPSSSINKPPASLNLLESFVTTQMHTDFITLHTRIPASLRSPSLRLIKNPQDCTRISPSVNTEAPENYITKTKLSP